MWSWISCIGDSANGQVELGEQDGIKNGEKSASLRNEDSASHGNAAEYKYNYPALKTTHAK